MLDYHSATWTAPDRYEVRPDARRFELFENRAAAIGLGVAVDYALSIGVEAIAARVSALATSLREGSSHPGHRDARPRRSSRRHRDVHRQRQGAGGSP